MAGKKVDINEAFSYSWGKVTADLLYFVGIAIVVALAAAIGGGRNHSGLLSLVSMLLLVWISGGYFKLFLSYYDGKKLSFDELFNQSKYFWRLVVAGILIGLLVTAGLILFIIPGIYLGIRYQFVPMLIVDKDLDVFEAMKQSSILTAGVKSNLFLFGLASGVVMLLGFVAFGVGALVAMPVVWLAQIYIYRNLED